MYALPGETRTATLGNAPSGLVGTLTVKVIDPLTGTVHQPPTAVGVVEYAAGEYAAPIVAPTTAGDYAIVWDAGTEEVAEELFVRGNLSSATPAAPGTPYFSVAEFRARYPDVTVARASDAEVERVRSLVEVAIERVTGVAFVPRVETKTIYPRQRRPRLGELRPFMRDVTSLNQEGVELDTTYWWRGEQVWHTPVTITYEYGMDAPPQDVKEAAMMLTNDWVISGPVSERATQLTDGAGGVVNLATPGVRGAHFGLPFVDDVVNSYTIPSTA